MTPSTATTGSGITSDTSTIDPDLSDVGQYVVTTSPPSAIHSTIKYNFTSDNSNGSGDVDVIIAANAAPE
eukprot:CAMPEP_0194205642 /NCGR_PEP_ID=MMETSP0156-20130528/4869_1 /TAXON_ID=33649 /ORGANISM="Thalassionema nitzschioides, Strain L26-B" /LENGTH=69 /DNA_ID=CAMNT_0038931965 /DNA_START=1006 /DNA_END=1215 /DNA_ORIENTATION=+